MSENYTQPMPDYGDLFTKDNFEEAVNGGCFIDYDGIGHPARLVDGKVMLATLWIKPSRLDEILDDATHIAWFNR